MRRFTLLFAVSTVAIAAAAWAAAESGKETSIVGTVKEAVGAVVPDASPKPFVEPNLKNPPNSGGLVSSKRVLEAPLEDDFVMGKKTATLNLIEYASMSCTHCAHFSSSVLPELQKKYIETGKVRYILRQFPLNEPALKAANLLDCVGEQDGSKYYVFAKVLFDAQNKWAFDANFMSNMETIAAVGGVSKEQFASCTGSTERESKVLQRQKLDKEELKIPGTPYIVIGNEIYTGERTPEAIGKFIDKKLGELPKTAP